jgi:hypothetical protein
MYPRIRFNPDNIEKYKEYCFHQIIRFSPWDDENYDEIKNVDSAIERWSHFLKTATPELLATIKYII